MTKEQYQELLKKPDISMEVWYDFFLERGGKEIGLQEFIAYFEQVTHEQPRIILGSDRRIKWVSIGSATRKFHEYYSQKFGL